MMAAIKTQRGGPRKETNFNAVVCEECNAAISQFADAYRVKAMVFNGTKAQSAFVWKHRNCVFKGGVK